MAVGLQPGPCSSLFREADASKQSPMVAPVLRGLCTSPGMIEGAFCDLSYEKLFFTFDQTFTFLWDVFIFPNLSPGRRRIPKQPSSCPAPWGSPMPTVPLASVLG